MESSPSQKIIISIDGPAGSGKSTLARGLARELGITYLNTGATYRSLAIKALREGINPDNEIEAAELAATIRIEFEPAASSDVLGRVYVDGTDVSDQLERNDVSTTASRISRHPAVRKAMVELQRRMADQICHRGSAETGNDGIGVVLEGRDTGTVVFPDAVVKIFLVASLEERARRRASDFADSDMTLEEMMDEIRRRDLTDAFRSVGPLRPADDAVIIDNTGWTKEETLNRALEIVRGKIGN